MAASFFTKEGEIIWYVNQPTELIIQNKEKITGAQVDGDESVELQLAGLDGRKYISSTDGRLCFIWL